MYLSFPNAPEFVHNGNFKSRGVVWQGQIGVLSDVTTADGTAVVFEPRKFVKRIDSVNNVWEDTTGETAMFFLMYKWPNEDEYEDSLFAYGQKILDNTPIVCIDLNQPGVIVEDYVTADNTSGLAGAQATWAAAAYGDPMYIDGAAPAMGLWTLTYAEATTSKARAIFMEYKNGYVTYMTTGAFARVNY